MQALYKILAFDLRVFKCLAFHLELFECATLHSLLPFAFEILAMALMMTFVHGSDDDIRAMALMIQVPAVVADGTGQEAVLSHQGTHAPYLYSNKRGADAQ